MIANSSGLTLQNPATYVGLSLIVITVALLVTLVRGFLADGAKQVYLLSAVAFGCVAFQLFHLFEHGLQVGYWFTHNDSPPWLTPWASTGRDGLGYWCAILPGKGAATPRGAEFLHVIGNGIFIIGVIAIAKLSRLASAHIPSVKGLAIFQGLHFVEHVMLFGTLLIGGIPRGISTLFGAVTGSELSSYRVWWHFSINSIATILGAISIIALYKAGATALPSRTASKIATSRNGSRRAMSVLQITVVGVLFLAIVPITIGKLAGSPIPPRQRNMTLNDLIDPGYWWQLLDPFVVIPIAAVLLFRKLSRSMNTGSSTKLSA